MFTIIRRSTCDKCGELIVVLETEIVRPGDYSWIHEATFNRGCSVTLADPGGNAVVVVEETFNWLMTDVEAVSLNPTYPSRS